jgi:hypothetical protein
MKGYVYKLRGVWKRKMYYTIWGESCSIQHGSNKPQRKCE